MIPDYIPNQKQLKACGHASENWINPPKAIGVAGIPMLVAIFGG